MNEMDFRKLAEDIAFIKGQLSSDLVSLKNDINEMKKSQTIYLEKTNKIYELENRCNQLEMEVKQIKENRTWISRLVTGAIITMAITAFVYLLTGKMF